jgi:hypothetical protein
MFATAYLVWCAVFLIVWLALYVWRPSARRTMLMVSLFATPLGPLSQYLHVQDYWRPETITGTLLGPEDFIIAFLIGGITAGFYSFFRNPIHPRQQRSGLWVPVVVAYALGVLLMYGSFYGLGLSSIAAAFLLLALFAVVPALMKPWVFKGAVLTGAVFTVFLFVFYVGFFWYYPGIVDAWWFGASGNRLYGVPVEEFVWAFLWGMAAASGSEVAERIKI